MRYILALSVILVLRPGAALAQDAACPLYRVNTSVLPVSTDPGGPANKGGLFDGVIVCVPRLQTVAGRQGGLISSTLDPAKARTPVEGWSWLEFLQALSSAEAEPLGGVAPAPPAPVVSAPPPAAVAPGAAVSAPAQPQASEAERAWALVKDTTDIRTLETFRLHYRAANPFLRSARRGPHRRIEEAPGGRDPSTAGGTGHCRAAWHRSTRLARCEGPEYRSGRSIEARPERAQGRTHRRGYDARPRGRSGPQ